MGAAHESRAAAHHPENLLIHQSAYDRKDYRSRLPADGIPVT